MELEKKKRLITVEKYLKMSSVLKIWKSHIDMLNKLFKILISKLKIFIYLFSHVWKKEVIIQTK